MSNAYLLELASLPVRQPNVGAALLRTHAIAAVIRLSIDPTPVPAGTMNREVAIDWVRKPGNVLSAVVHRQIGWEDVPELADGCITYPLTWNDQDLTEMAAIAIMALLIDDLEGGVVQRVLPIGSGGDYLVVTRQAQEPDQVEVSGIWQDTDGRTTRRRLAEKADQVLTHCKCGFASVTAFAHPPDSVVQSCLHFVRRRQKKRKQRR